MIRTGLIWSVGAIAIMLGTIAWVATVLPTGEPIPVHWGLDGPDAYSERRGALITLGILPLVAIITAIVMSLAPALDPFRDNLLTSRKAYTAVWASSMVLMAVLTVGIGLSMVSQLPAKNSAQLLPRLSHAMDADQRLHLGEDPSPRWPRDDDCRHVRDCGRLHPRRQGPADRLPRPCDFGQAVHHRLFLVGVARGGRPQRRHRLYCLMIRPRHAIWPVPVCTVNCRPSCARLSASIQEVRHAPEPHRNRTRQHQAPAAGS